MNTNRAVLIGGVTTSERSLSAVADTMYELGLATGVDIFAFPSVMNRRDELRRAVAGGLVVAHSAGIMAVDESMSPDRLVSYSGPEPRFLGRLLLAGAGKTAHYIRRVVTGPGRQDYGRVLADNVIETTINFSGNRRHLPAISAFSTVYHLHTAIDAGIQAERVVTLGDTFFPYDPQHQTIGVPTQTPAGEHDQLLLTPLPMLELLCT